MTLNLSVKDIHFIKYLFKYLNFFLITPWYDFQSKKLYCRNLCKLYASFLVVVKVFWIIHTVNDEYLHETYHMMLFSQKCIGAATTINLVSLNILTIVKTCIWDGEHWKTLITNLEHIDEHLSNKDKTEACILKNFYCRFFVKNLMFLLVVAHQLHVWSSFTGLSVVKIFWMSCVKEVYYEFLTICLMSAIVTSFKSRYEDLNRKLADLEGGVKIRERFRAIHQEYRTLGASVASFNELFGYQMVLIIFHCGLELVSCLNIAFVSHMAGLEEFHTQIFVAGLSLLVCVFYNFLHIVLPIDWTAQEARKFLSLSCQIQEKFVDDVPALEACIKLVNCSKDFLPVFSAAGFFKIDKSLIFSVVANVATYFIITIQLNEANIGHLLSKN